MNEDDLFDLAHTLKELKGKLPYHINVIDLLGGANENANTKIFCKLLKYKESENYPILNSFLCLIKNKCANASFIIKNPHIESGKEYIDGLIEDTAKTYGIIIENKIHNAIDQYHQIEHYIEKVNKHGINYKNIYVIYLTRDGNKEIESYSLTPKAKKYLDVTEDDSGRFITLNYRDDILPWLKVEILPNCKIKEDCLRSAIEQYIDYLEGMFELRRSEESNTINRIMKEKLYQKLGITENSSLSEQYNKVATETSILEQLKQRIQQFQNKIVKDKIYAPFEKITKAFFQSGNTRTVEIKNAIEREAYLFIYYKEWGWYVHFEWVPLNINQLVNGNMYTLQLHTEGKLSSLKEKLLNDDEFLKVVKSINGCNIHINDRTNVLKKDYETNIPFINMTFEQQKDFLEGAYKEILPIIPIIDRLLEESASKQTSMI